MKAFFAIIFVSSFGLAYSPKYFDIQSYATQPIDVANEEKTISLRVEIQSPSSFSIPDAAILSEDEGFDCEIKQKILLFLLATMRSPRFIIRFLKLKLSGLPEPISAAASSR